jgi:hypothetical protein
MTIFKLTYIIILLSLMTVFINLMRETKLYKKIVKVLLLENEPINNIMSSTFWVTLLINVILIGLYFIFIASMVTFIANVITN